LAPTFPTSGGRSVGIVRPWTKATEFSNKIDLNPKVPNHPSITLIVKEIKGKTLKNLEPEAPYLLCAVNPVGCL
jgi:hypothetical protein